jgi:hypothetical protein
MMGALTNTLFKVRNAARHFSSKSKATSFGRRCVKGLVIFEKSLINLLWNPAWPRKVLKDLTSVGGGSCSTVSNLALSTSILCS